MTLADLDGDGGEEVLFVTQLTIHALRADGSELPGWPRGQDSQQYLESPPAVGDLDGDGQPEVVARAYYGIDILRGDGTLVTTFHNGAYSGLGAPVLADLDGDGQLDILFVASTRLWALRADGTDLPGFPISVSCRNDPPAPCFEGDIAVGDMDGDGSPEIALIGNGHPRRAPSGEWKAVPAHLRRRRDAEAPSAEEDQRPAPHRLQRTGHGRHRR